MTEKKQEILKKITPVNLNLEKWAIFTTSRFKGVRSIKRKDTEGNEQTVSILPFTNTDGKFQTLSASEYKILDALYQLFSEAAEPETAPVLFSIKNIANQLNLKLGGRTAREIKTCLLNLKGVQILYENSYKVSKDGGYIKMTEPFTILSHLKIFERKKRKANEPYFAFSEFKFHPYIIEAIKKRYIKTIRLDVIRELKSDTAILLYRWLDLVLADKKELEIVVNEKLARDLGLEHTRPDNLLTQLKEACLELQGKELTTGQLACCQIEDTVSGLNYKLVVKKIKLSTEKNNTELPEGITTDLETYQRIYDLMNPEEQAAVKKLQEEILEKKFGGFKESQLSNDMAFIEAVETLTTPQKVNS